MQPIFVNGLNRVYPDPRLTDEMLKSAQYHDLKAGLHKAMATKSVVVLSPTQIFDCPATYELMIDDTAPMRLPSLLNAQLVAITRPSEGTLRAFRDSLCDPAYASRLTTFFDPHSNAVGARRMDRIGRRMAALAEQLDNMPRIYCDERGLTDTASPDPSISKAAADLHAAMATQPYTDNRNAYRRGLVYLQQTDNAGAAITAIAHDPELDAYRHLAFDAVSDTADIADRRASNIASLALNPQTIINTKFPPRLPAKEPNLRQELPFDLDFGIA